MYEDVGKLANRLVERLQGQRCPECGGRFNDIHFADCATGAEYGALKAELDAARRQGREGA